MIKNAFTNSFLVFLIQLIQSMGMMLLLNCSFLMLVGCNESRVPTYPVQGQLRFDDGSVPMFGEIEFYNEHHQINARGSIKRDGSFSVGTYQPGDGAVAGTHKITIQQILVSPLTSSRLQEIDHHHGKLISRQYNNYQHSDLSCEIVPGRENRLELEILREAKQTESGLPLETDR